MNTQKYRVLLIINPTSGQMKSKFAVYDMIEYFSKKDCVTTVLTTGKRGDATDYVVQNAMNHDAVVCCGGDGTLNEVITGMMQVENRIPIGFIPCGTTNDMAKTLQLPYRSLKKCVKTVLHGEPQPFDVGCFGEDRYFNYVASFGAFTRVSYNTPQWLKHMLGHFAYVLDGIMSVGEIRPYHMRVVSDNEEFEDDFIFGAVTNSLSVGGIVRLKEDDVALSDGKFEVMLIRKPNNPAELQRILNGVLRMKFDDRHVRFLHTSQIAFFPKQEVAWTVDGEFGGTPGEISIQNLNKAVSIIRDI